MRQPGRDVETNDSHVSDDARHLVSRETMRRLQAYASLVQTWNRSIGLISSASVPVLWTRHVEDCLQLVPLVPPGAGLGADLGSGAGLPGLILAVATGVPFLLVESDQRKAAFLREAVRVTGAPARVCARRAERVAAPADLVTSRGTASIATLLEWARGLVRPATTCVFMKGRQVSQELRDAEAAWSMDVEIVASRTEPCSNIVVLRDVRRRSP